MSCPSSAAKGGRKQSIKEDITVADAGDVRACNPCFPNCHHWHQGLYIHFEIDRNAQGSFARAAIEGVIKHRIWMGCGAHHVASHPGKQVNM